MKTLVSKVAKFAANIASILVAKTRNATKQTPNFPPDCKGFQTSLIDTNSEVIPPQRSPLKPFEASLLERPTGDVWNDYDIVACYDTEFCRLDGFDPKIDPDKHNFLLSMQLSAFVREDDGWRYVEDFRLPDGNRPRLAELCGWVLDVCHVPRRADPEPKVLLVAHYSVAEWSMLADPLNWIHELMAIGKTVVTAKDIQIGAVRPGRHTTQTRLTIRDTLLLTPGRGSLEKASRMTSVPKIRLEEYGYSRAEMLKLFHEDTELFQSYAMTDTRAGLEYLVKIGNKVELITGVARLPMTLGGMAANGFHAWLANCGYSINAYHGFTEKQGKKAFRKGKGKVEKVKNINRMQTDAIASNCFHGGRNFAAVHRHVLLPDHQMVVDFDLAGAYSAAMAMLPAIDFKYPPKRIMAPKALKQLQTKLGGRSIPIAMGEVSFEFPDGVEPCLPVSTHDGLQYPKCGVSQCGLPEVLLAIERGCVIELNAFYTWTSLQEDNKVVFAFADYLSRIVQERAKYDKGTVENELYKEAANSLYGKTAQGSKERRIRDLAGQYSDLSESKVTNVAYAAMTTSLVRAALCAMEDAMRSVGGEVLASTTDGCMCVFDVGDNKAYDMKNMPTFDKLLPNFDPNMPRYAPIQAMQAGRQNLNQNPCGWIEAKHIGNEYVVFKTRGYNLAHHGVTTFNAKGGHKIDGDMDEVKGTLDLLFSEAEPSMLYFKRLLSCFDIADRKTPDLVNKPASRRANTDWDWKRELLEDGSSRPFPNITEIYRHREAAQSIRKKGQRATREAVKLNLEGIKLHGGTEATIRRMLLRAVIKHVGGWSPGKMQYHEISQKLGVSVQDLKNAKIREYKPQTLPRGEMFERLAAEICLKLEIQLTDAMRDQVCMPQ